MNVARSPSWNLEAERALLGSILLDSSALREVDPVLTSEDSYDEAHRIIYRAIRDLYDRGGPLAAVSLAGALARRDELLTVGGTRFIADLVNSVPHSANAKWYAGIVRSKSIERHILRRRDGNQESPGP